MSLRILSITLLLISGCLYFSSAAGRYPGKNIACCIVVTTKDISKNVTGNTYRAQYAKNNCVEAKIITAPKGTCVDPNAKLNGLLRYEASATRPSVQPEVQPARQRFDSHINIAGFCCDKIKGHRPIEDIKQCYEQKARPSCQHHAFVIKTNRHKMFCVKPTPPWLKELIKTGALQCPPEYSLI